MDKERENLKQRNELTVQAARLEQEIKDFKAQINQVGQLAEKAEKDAASQRNKAFILGVISNIVSTATVFAGPVVATVNAVSRHLKNEKENENVGSRSNGNSKDISSEISEKKKELEKDEKDKKNQLDKLKEEILKLGAEYQTDKIKESIKEKETKIKQLESALETINLDIKNLSTSMSKEYVELAHKSQEKELELLKLKFQYQDLERKSNADLVENVGKMKSLTEEKNYLATSIKSLQLTKSTMGKVKTIFENTRSFWTQIAAHCQKLSNISNIKDMCECASLDDSFKVIFANEIKKNGLNWLALASINYTALKSIESVKLSFDEVVSNLPDREEAEKIVKELAPKMILMLEKEKKEINENQLQLTKQINSLSPKQA